LLQRRHVAALLDPSTRERVPHLVDMELAHPNLPTQDREPRDSIALG
jgi:hypothetical protein